MAHTEPLSLQFSARVLLFKKFLYIIYPIILYSTLFIFVSHKSFYVGYYIASSIIFIVLIIAHYEQLSQLTRLAINNDLWKLSIQNNTLKYYNPHKKKTFQIHLSQINTVHRNPSELKITLLNTKEKIDKGSFVLNLSDIEKVRCLIVKDSESGDSYHYHIKLKSGERIDLDDSSKVSLSELAPLLGNFRRIWS